MVVTSKCPSCGSPRIYPSRLRSAFERLRRAMTEKQPYRCHACNHRGWHPMDVPISGPSDTELVRRPSGARRKPLTTDDLDRLE